MSRALGELGRAVLAGLISLGVILLLTYGSGVIVGVFWVGVCSIAGC